MPGKNEFIDNERIFEDLRDEAIPVGQRRYSEIIQNLPRSVVMNVTFLRPSSN